MHFRLPRELRPGFRIDKGILNLYTAFPSCTSTIGVTRAFLLLLLSAGYPLWLLLGAFSRTSAVVGLENGDFDPLGKEHFCSARLGSDVVKNLGCWSWWPNHLPRMTQWIQYKLGKQYLLAPHSGALVCECFSDPIQSHPSNPTYSFVCSYQVL